MDELNGNGLSRATTLGLGSGAADIGCVRVSLRRLGSLSSTTVDFPTVDGADEGFVLELPEHKTLHVAYNIQHTASYLAATFEGVEAGGRFAMLSVDERRRGAAAESAHTPRRALPGLGAGAEAEVVLGVCERRVLLPFSVRACAEAIHSEQIAERVRVHVCVNVVLVYDACHAVRS